MPFKSEAQRRKFYYLMRKGKMSPATVRRWEVETGDARLPERVKQAEPPPPKGVSLAEWDKILQDGPKKVKTTARVKAAVARIHKNKYEEHGHPRAAVGSVPWHFHNDEHGYRHCTGSHDTPYAITEHSKGHMIDVPEAVGHGLKRKPTLFQFPMKIPGGFLLESGELVGEKKASTEIGPSAIAGKGLIATRGFNEGDVIAPVVDVVPEGQGDMRPDLLQTAQGRYLNHSYTPNARNTPLSDTQYGVRATHDIAPGEEITADYCEAQATYPGAFILTPEEELEQSKQAAYYLGVKQALYRVNLTRRPA